MKKPLFYGDVSLRVGGGTSMFPIFPRCLFLVRCSKKHFSTYHFWEMLWNIEGNAFSQKGFLFFHFFGWFKKHFSTYLYGKCRWKLFPNVKDSFSKRRILKFFPIKKMRFSMSQKKWVANFYGVPNDSTCLFDHPYTCNQDCDSLYSFSKWLLIHVVFTLSNAIATLA